MRPCSAAVSLLLLAVFYRASSGDEWPIPRPQSGFGASGPSKVVCDSIPSPQWSGKKVFIFHPADISRKYPLVLFCHGSGATEPHVYGPLISNIASRGHVVVFSPYKNFSTDPVQGKKHRIITTGFEAAARFARFIDTTRTGIVGHSFGAGAAPAIAWHFLVEMGWGKNGSFLYLMAPWYSYFITQDELELFPQETPCIVQVFHDDIVNDPRMALDIFNSLGVPDSQKAFIELFSDTLAGHRLFADHFTPFGPAAKNCSEDALDFFGIYKFIDAIADAAFRGSAEAKSVALGGGTAAQRYMGTRPDKQPVRECAITRSPALSPEQRQYENPWGLAANPRRDVSPLFAAEYRRNSFSLARKMFRSYWEYQKAKVMARLGQKPEPPVDTSVCPFQPIASGFGAHGPYTMAVDSLPQPRWPGRSVYVFSPESLFAPAPLVLFCHGYAKSNPQNYLPFINHIVSRGNVVVFSPFQNIAFDPKGAKKYATISSGFRAAVAAFKNRIDTTRIGYVGHSYGAGGIPALSMEGIAENKWGANGAFLFLMAPFYSYEIDKIKLRLYPSNVNMMVQVYADDVIADHRMGIALFNAIAIPKERKNYTIVFSDSCSGRRLIADHNTPKGPFDPRSEEDALDYYALYRLFDALAAFTFKADSLAGAIAFGRGKATCYMGTWPNGKPVRPLVATSAPYPVRPQDNYAFSWDLSINPLKKEIPIKK